MVAMVDQLIQLKGQRVLLEFEDGEIVEAKLMKVDAVEHQDIVFDVLSVRKSVGETYTREKVYVAPIATVTRVSTLGS
ncbi:MAG TPA: hypothetical protein VF761_14515 [Gemmatimonadaceae bacterium]